MMAIGRVENVPSLERDNLLYKAKLEHSFDELRSKASTIRSELTGSFGIEAAQRVVELDLNDDNEDEGEIMLLAMILLQLQAPGVKFSGGFPLSSEDLSDNMLDQDQDQDQDNNNKKKRQRTSPDQLAILEQIFQTDKMPSQQTRVQLADQLGMSSRRVQIWFQNKRAKVKRGSSKEDGTDSSPLDMSALSSSSGISESSSPVPDSFQDSPSSSSSFLPSPNSPAVVPSSPSLPHTPKQHTQVSQIQFSLSSLASQPILLSSEFSAMSAC